MNILKVLNFSNKRSAAPGRPIPGKAKTERRYTPAHTAPDFCRTIEQHGDRIAYEYFVSPTDTATMTYTEFAGMVRRFSAGLEKLGMSHGRVAVIGETSPKWVAAYLAVMAQGGVVVPMDRELAPNEIFGFLSGISCDAVVAAPSLDESLADLLTDHPSVRYYITMGEEKKNDKVMLWSEVEQSGAEAVEAGWDYPPCRSRGELAEMLFTSGTTGSSKCVMLCQRNVFSVVNSCAESVDFTPDEVVVSVLPMHHTYGLACMLAELLYGVKVCINDSLRHVLRNFARFRPTALVLVPLFVQTMYKKIINEVEKKGKLRTFNAGIAASRVMIKVGVDLRKKLFAEVREAFGGRLEKIICGGAPLKPDLIYAFEDFGISIYEGYGITECAPLAAVTPYYKRKSGSVGPSVPCCTIRVDGETINEAGFAEGEIQIHGDNVMLGYFENPEANAAAFTDDGWYRTGDVGYMDADGYVYITGRMKSVIVLENGKNVFPEEIEEYLGSVDLIAESVVVGRKSEDGDSVVLTAIVFPNADKFEETASDEEKLEAIKHAIRRINKKLPSFKQVREVELRNEEFPKTTSKKIRRHLIK